MKFVRLGKESGFEMAMSRVLRTLLYIRKGLRSRSRTVGACAKDERAKNTDQEEQDGGMNEGMALLFVSSQAFAFRVPAVAVLCVL